MLRAGAKVADVEFIQFHPTVLWLGENSEGQQPLISEAVRGEGAYLLDNDGNRFMQGIHPLAELAPRDVVAISIMRVMNRSKSQHVWLDVRHLSGFKERFPTIYNSCISHGIDPMNSLIPVVARHVLCLPAGRLAIWQQMACAVLAGVAALVLGLVFLGRDGKMSTYGLMVLLQATCQWMLSHAWRR